MKTMPSRRHLGEKIVLFLTVSQNKLPEQHRPAMILPPKELQSFFSYAILDITIMEKIFTAT